jgi:hypothetical protein
MLEDHFFDMDGQPIDVLEWGRLFEDKEARTLGRDDVGDRVVVTMWLGHDEDRWVGDHEGDPRIFGTAVFAGKGNLVHEVRTTNKADALTMHGLVLQSQRTQQLMREKERGEHGYEER